MTCDRSGAKCWMICTFSVGDRDDTQLMKPCSNVYIKMQHSESRASVGMCSSLPIALT